MAKKRMRDPFKAINPALLADVSGGRMIPRQGTDPRVIQGVQTLVKTMSEVGQVITAKNQKSEAEGQQMMQQLMQKMQGARSA